MFLSHCIEKKINLNASHRLPALALLFCAHLFYSSLSCLVFLFFYCSTKFSLDDDQVPSSSQTSPLWYNLTIRLLLSNSLKKTSLVGLSCLFLSKLNKISILLLPSTNLIHCLSHYYILYSIIALFFYSVKSASTSDTKIQ